MCRNLEIGAKYAREYQLDCVTVEGDQAASRGWLKGGHHNRSRSTVTAYKNKLTMLEEIQLLENKIEESKGQIRDADTKIIQCMNEIQHIETKTTKARYTKIYYFLLLFYRCNFIFKKSI